MSRTLTANQREVQAFAAHAALIKMELRHPSLKDNPFWTMLRQDAYERFAEQMAGARP